MDSDKPRRVPPTIGRFGWCVCERGSCNACNPVKLMRPCPIPGGKGGDPMDAIRKRLQEQRRNQYVGATASK